MAGPARSHAPRKGKGGYPPYMDFGVLAAHGIPFLPCETARDERGALEAARRIGYPVALKIMARSFLHKSDRKALALNVRNEAELKAEFARLKTLAGGEAVDGYLVQRFAPARVELIVGGRIDPQFGPVVLVGFGGIYTEVFRDAVIRVCPLDEEMALEMVRSLKAYPLLSGARGQKGVDQKALAALIVNASRLMMEGQVRELDLNPVLMSPTGPCAADVRIL